MWRSGQALRPYFKDVRSIVKKKHLLPCLAGYDVVSEQKLAFTHFPIRDCSVTDDDRVLELARSLVRSIAEGHILYLHCWGGHGRTGTLVCIMLHLMYGLNDKEAMHYCQTVHDLRQCPVVVGSPQTQTQRDQVSRVILSLMTQNRFSSRSMSGDASMLDSQGLPSPVANKGDTLQSKLGSPRSASKSQHSSPATAVPSLVQPAAEVPMPAAGVRTVDQTDTVAMTLAMPTISAAVPNTDAAVAVETQVDEAAEFAEPQPQDDSSEEAEEGSTRMRLGTMDESDLYVEVASDVEGDQASNDNNNMAVSIPSPVKEGEIEEGELEDHGHAEKVLELNQEIEEEAEPAADEMRGVEAAIVEEAAPPMATKPSFRPLWRRNAA